MSPFLAVITGFPTVIYTGLLAIVLVYWLFTIIGALDIDMLNIDADVNATSVSGIAGFLSAYRLNGVPVTVILSLITLIGWLLCYFGTVYVVALFDGALLRYGGGTVLIIVSFFTAVFLTGYLIKPLQGLFVTHMAISKEQLIGVVCRITTLKVTDTFGQAVIEDGEAGMIVPVRASLPNTFAKGDKAIILAYHSDSDSFDVIAEEDLLQP